MLRGQWLTGIELADATVTGSSDGKIDLRNQRVPAAFLAIRNGDSDRRLERRS